MTENPKKNGSTIVTVSPKARKALIVLCSGAILTFYLHTALAPALPNIIETFNISIDLASWVLTAYMVTGAVMSIVIGRLADLYGAKKMYLIVMICYTVGVSLAPFSQDISTLLALRVLQGVAVAVLPLGSKIVRDVYPDEKYPQAQGILTSMFSIGSVLGLVVGAFVLQFLNWQGLFFTAIPFSVIVILLALKFLPSRRPRIVTGKPSEGDKEAVSEIQRIDVKGAITLSVGLVSLLISLSLAPFIESLLIEFVVALVVGFASLGLFVRIERRTATPLVDLKVMSHRVIVLGNIALLMFGIIQYIIFQAVPILARTPEAVGGFGLEPIGVGILQLPFSIAVMILGPVSGFIAVKYGVTKLLLPAAGVTVLAFTSLWLLHSTPEQVMANLTLYGISIGFFVSLDAVIILFIPRAVMGSSAAVLNTMRIIGGSIGPIIAGSIMEIYSTTITVGGKEQTFTSLEAFNILFFICFIISVALAISILLIRRRAVKLLA